MDADSEGEEGRYYLFSVREAREILGEDSGRYCALFDITADGNFEGKNLPNLLKSGPLAEADADFAARCHRRMLVYREKRVPPLRDEKILISSNGLMLAALSTCARLMGREDYLRLAVELAGFLTSRMQRGGRYYASYRGGLGNHPASSEDYAYLAWGLLRLHQATLDGRWLSECARTCDRLLELFADADGLLWMSGRDVDDLPLRTKSTQDGALPSGNAVASGVFQRLFLLTAKQRYKTAHDAIRDALGGEAGAYPTAYTALISSVMLGRKGLKVELPARMAGIREKYHPFATFKAADGEKALVCGASSCLPPVEDEAELERLLTLKQRE